MASLIIKLPDQDDQEYGLTAGVVIIGRHPDDNIYLGDESVSSHHARVLSLGDRYYLHDLDSTNGTRVNGQRITQIELRDSDAIRFGKVHGSFSRRAPNEVQATLRVSKARIRGLALFLLIAVILFITGHFVKRGQKDNLRVADKENESPDEIDRIRRRAVAATESDVDECLLTLSDQQKSIEIRRHAFMLLREINAKQGAKFSQSIRSYMAFYLALQYLQGVVVKGDNNTAIKLLDRADELGDAAMHQNVKRTREQLAKDMDR